MGWLKYTERVLLGVACACFAICAGVALYAAPAFRASAHPLKPAGQSAAAAGTSSEAGAGGTHASTHVMGRLEIRQLGLSVPILSDYDTGSLLKGVGHVPGTAMPGGLGTLGLAGHRDTYFRPLRNIKKDMDIRVVSDEGVYHYLVDSTEIVKPENVAVLDIGNRPELTLITCYPFYYVGAAPMRFIVHAHLLSALPDDLP